MEPTTSPMYEEATKSRKRLALEGKRKRLEALEMHIYIQTVALEGLRLEAESIKRDLSI